MWLWSLECVLPSVCCLFIRIFRFFESAAAPPVRAAPLVAPRMSVVVGSTTFTDTKRGFVSEDLEPLVEEFASMGDIDLEPPSDDGGEFSEDEL